MCNSACLHARRGCTHTKVGAYICVCATITHSLCNAQACYNFTAPAVCVGACVYVCAQLCVAVEACPLACVYMCV